MKKAKSKKPKKSKYDQKFTMTADLDQVFGFVKAACDKKLQEKKQDPSSEEE